MIVKTKQQQKTISLMAISARFRAVSTDWSNLTCKIYNWSKNSSQLAVLSNFPFLTENTANKCVWSRHLTVYDTNTSMAVPPG